MIDDATLEYGPAVEAAARAMYERTAAEHYRRTKRPLPDFDEMPEFARFQYREECLEILKVGAPFFAGQGWEIGYGNGDDDSRIVGGDYYENPWGDYVQDEG